MKRLNYILRFLAIAKSKLSAYGLPKTILLSILMVVIGLSAFSQSPSRFISLRPAYPLVIGESAADGVVLSNNGLYVDNILLDSLPTYEIGEIIDQTVRNADGFHGFYVRADSLHSTNVTYSYEVSGAPQGRIVFNEATGRFLYYPTEDEYMPFVVTFSATNGTDDLSEEVIFNLRPITASEENAFDTTGTMPDGEDYTIVAETSTSKYFNYEERTVYSYSISGKDVIFDDAVKNKLWGLNGREDIYELNIYAERLIIRSALSFPGANVTIYAKTVIFEDKGNVLASMNITATSKETLSDGEAEKGIDGGYITLFIKEFKANSGIRLIANGAKGQSTNRNGTPGNGGNGGTITSSMDVSSFCDFVRGSGGVKYDVAEDGTADAGPVIEYGASGLSGQFVLVERPNAYLHPYYVSAVMRHANDAYINNFNNEVYQTCLEYQALIEDVLGSSSEDSGVNEGIIDDLGDVLGSRQNSPDSWLDELLEDDSEVTMGLQNNLVEINKMLFKLEQGLDYFGNPIGWTPLLSFEVMRSTYENEINQAIKTMYLYYWLNDKDRTLQEKVEACQVAANNTEQEIDDNQELLNSLVLEIPVLQDEAEDIANQIDVLTKRIESIQRKLLNRAIKTVKKRHWLNNLFNIGKVVVSVISTVASAGSAIGSVIGAVGSFASTVKTLNSVAATTSNPSFLSTIKTTINSIKTAYNQNDSLINVSFKKASQAINKVEDKIDTLKTVLASTKVSNSEVQAEYNKLLASSLVYKDLKNQFEELSAKKEELVAHMNQVFSDMTATLSDLSNDALALDAFRRDAFVGNSKRDLNAMLYLEKMEQRAKNRLLLYDYYLRKAYEYRMLKPYTGEFNLVGMFERVEGLASIGESAVISNSNYQTLAAIFEERISDITQAIVSDFTMERTAEVTYKLSKEQINALNAGDDITMNFYEDINALRNKDNVRIVDIDIFNLGKHVVGTVESSGTMELRFKHGGISKFRKDGEIFWFNHKTKSTSNPHKWIISYDANTGTMTTHKPSAASQSLLSSLVGSNQIMYFSRPSAWGDITLSKTVNTDFADIVIDSLTVKITYDYTDRKEGMYYIDIATNEELMPYISCTDSRGKSGGYGRLHKAYSSSQPVTFTAIGKYESYYFKNWTDRAGNIVSNSAELTVNKQKDQSYVANYEYRGAILDVVDTIFVGNEGGPFVVNVRNTGNDETEMDWYVGDSLSTWVHVDGSVEGVDEGTFTLTVDVNPTGKRRVGFIELIAPEAYNMLKRVYILQTDEIIAPPYQPNALATSDVQASPGSHVELVVKLNNEDEVKHCQFDLRLPDGIAVATKSNGKLDVKLTSRAENHSVSGKLLENGDYRFVISSLDNESFTGNNGALLKIAIDIPATMEAGDYRVKLMNAELSVYDGHDLNVVKPADMESRLTISGFMPGDVNNDGSVSVTDVGCVINYILESIPTVFVFEAADVNVDESISVTDAGIIINMILNEGSSRATQRLERDYYELHPMLEPIADGFQLMLEGKENLIGFQFDVKLGDGAGWHGVCPYVELAGGENDHLLTCRQMSDGSYRVVCYSLTNSSFAADASPLLTISVVGDASKRCSSVVISGIRLTTTDFEELRPADLIGATTGIADAIGINQSAEKKVYTLDGRLCRTFSETPLKELKAGIYMIGNRIVVVR